jgi:toxin ParE1/3/4
MADLAAAGRWIAQDSRAAATRLRAAVLAMTQHIGDHPLAGTERPELAASPYRFAVVRRFPYIAIYDPTQHPPLILRLVHGARDLPDVLREFREDDGL